MLFNDVGIQVSVQMTFTKPRSYPTKALCENQECL